MIGSLLVVLSYDKGHELRGNLCRSDCGRVLDSWSVFTSALTQKCITIESHVEPLLAADYSMSSQDNKLHEHSRSARRLSAHGRNGRKQHGGTNQSQRL